jgi:DNA-binding FadR family transcriptional regulator
VGEYDAAQLLAVDREFHTALLDATDNDYFRRALVPVWSVVERAMFGMLSIPEIVARAWSEHEQIAEAVRAGDPDRAEQALRLHLGNGAEQLAQVIPDRTDGVARG